MSVAGVDDAGRGPVIGPLVIAGVLMKKDDLPRLVELGVKDSKLLSSRRREKLSETLKKLAVKHHVVILPPEEIDRVVETGRRFRKLNWLEAQAMARVITELKPDLVYVDASDVSCDRFRRQIAEFLNFDVQIVSEHKADITYPVVSAASIIAKVERDQAISLLKQKYGDVGSGYVADQKTMHFLENWLKKFGSYPSFVRKSWKPAKKLKSKENQTKLI